MIKLFGPLSITVQQRQINRFRTKKAAWLLARLATARGPLDRASLAAELWPATDPEMARKSLTVALSSLRRVLEPVGIERDSVLQTFRDTCALAPGSFETDLQVLRTALASGSVEGVLHTLPPGDDLETRLLEGIDTDWAASIVTETLTEFSDFASTRLPGLLDSQDWPQVLSLSRTWLALDPYADQAAGPLVRALIAQDRRIEAVRFAVDFRRRLADDIGRKPSSQFAGAVAPLKEQPSPQDPQPPQDGKDPWLQPGLQTVLLHSGPPLAETPDTRTDSETNASVALIPSPQDAARFADLVARRTDSCALHVGETGTQTKLDNTLQTARDLFAHSSPGEVVCSPAYANLVAWDPDPSFTVVSQAGKHRLKSTETVVRPLTPVFHTRFFGREAEIKQLTDLVQDPNVRSLTLTGIGGMGKTRLSLEVLDRLPDDVFKLFVTFRLAEPDRHPAFLLADALSVKVETAEEAVDAVRKAADGRPAVIVFDNCETAPDVFVPWLESIIARWPELTALSSSRIALSLNAEVEHRLAPLPVPRKAAADLEENPSVRLFLDRAQVRNPDVTLTSANAETIAEICRQTEGVPLSLELAGARVGPLSLTRISQGLAQSLDFLKKSRQNPLDPQSSVDTVLVWTFSQLPESRRTLVAGLGLFAQTGAESEVHQTLGLETKDDALDLLLEAQDLSLVTLTEDRWRETRFSMLHVVHEFLQRQSHRPEDDTRFLETFLNLGEQLAVRFADDDQADAQDRMAADYPNFIAALSLAESNPATFDQAFRLADALWRHWDIRHHAMEGIRHFGRLVKIDAPDSLPKSTVHLRYAHFILRQDDGIPESERHNRIGTKIREKMGTPLQIASARGQYAQIMMNKGDYEEALAGNRAVGKAFMEVGNELVYAISLSNIGNIYTRLGSYDEATATFNQSLKIRRRLKDHRGIASSLIQSSLPLELSKAPPERIVAHAEESLVHGLLVFDVSLLPLSLGLLCRNLDQLDPVRAYSCGLLAQKFLENAGRWSDSSYSCTEAMESLEADLSQDQKSLGSTLVFGIDVNDQESVRTAMRSPLLLGEIGSPETVAKNRSGESQARR